MQFFLDHNVPDSVKDVLLGREHDVTLLRDDLPPDSPDSVVAAFCENLEAVLVTADRDFKRKVAPRIPDGQKTRFRKLSRITLECRPTKARDRMLNFIEMIEAEFAISQQGGFPMRISIGDTFFRTDR